MSLRHLTPYTRSPVWCLIGLTIVLADADLLCGQQRQTPLDALKSFASQVRGTRTIALAPDGKSVAVGGNDTKIVVLSIPDGNRLASVPIDAHLVIALAFSPDGQHLAASIEASRREQRNSIVILDCRSWKPHANIPLLGQTAESLAWSPDSSVLAAGCTISQAFTGVIRLYESRTGAEQGVLTSSGRSGVPKHLQFSPDGTSIAAGGNGAILDLWDVKRRTMRWSAKAHLSIICGLAFSSGGETVATICEEGAEVKLWDAASGKPVGELLTRGTLTDVAFSPTGRTLAVASHREGQQLVLWNAATREPQATLSLGNGLPLADVVAYSGPTNLLVAEGRDTIYCWNVARLEDPEYAWRLQLAQVPQLKNLQERIQAKPDATEFALIWEFNSRHTDELRLVAQLAKLQKLTISCYSTKDSNLAAGESFLQLQKLPGLEELTLQNVLLDSLRGPSQLPHLKKLSFVGDCRINSLQGLGPFQQLEELDMRGIGIANPALEKFSHVRSLKKVQLAGTIERSTGTHNYLSSAALAAIEPLTGLEVLEISGDAIDSEAGRHLIPLANLRELRISNTRINDGCAKALASMFQLEVAELPTVGDETLQALTKLPKLRKVTARGQSFSDFALEQLGQTKSVTELQLYGYWTPYDALKFARDLKSMSRDELKTYELMRCLAAEGEYLSRVRAAQRNTALMKPFTPAAIPKLTSPAVSGDNPNHPRYDEHVASKQAILNMYLKLDDAKLDTAQRMQILGDEALRAADTAFADRLEMRTQVQTRIRGMAGLK